MSYENDVLMFLRCFWTVHGRTRQMFDVRWDISYIELLFEFWNVQILSVLSSRHHFLIILNVLSRFGRVFKSTILVLLIIPRLIELFPALLAGQRLYCYIKANQLWNLSSQPINQSEQSEEEKMPHPSIGPQVIHPYAISRREKRRT